MKTIQEILKLWKEEVNLHGVIQFSFDRSSGLLCIYTHDTKRLLRAEERYLKLLKARVRGFQNLMLIETAYFWA